MKRLIFFLIALFALFPCAAFADSVRYEGSGLSMVEIPSFPFYPCRMVFSVDAEVNAKIEITGGNYDWKEEFAATKESMSCVFSYDSTNYGEDDLTLLITTTANWTLDIYSLEETGTPVFNGSGNAISDLFLLNGPIPVTISYDANKNDYDYLSIYLVTPSEFGYLRESVFSESLRGDSAKGSTDLFIKPDKDRPCFYIVECNPSTTWAITLK